jgi:uncharacterized cupin superfamily protein
MQKLLAVGLLVMLPVAAYGACPVGKKEKDTWCTNHVEWRCDRCGSEYCQIITGRSCYKEDSFDGLTSKEGIQSSLAQAIRRNH